MDERNLCYKTKLKHLLAKKYRTGVPRLPVPNQQFPPSPVLPSPVNQFANPPFPKPPETYTQAGDVSMSGMFRGMIIKPMSGEPLSLWCARAKLQSAKHAEMHTDARDF